MTRPRTAVRAVIDTQYTPPTPAELAAARRVLAKYDALDVAEMLGPPCATQKSDAVLTGTTAQ